MGSTAACESTVNITSTSTNTEQIYTKHDTIQWKMAHGSKRVYRRQFQPASFGDKHNEPILEYIGIERSCRQVLRVQRMTSAAVANNVTADHTTVLTLNHNYHRLCAEHYIGLQQMTSIFKDVSDFLRFGRR